MSSEQRAARDKIYIIKGASAKMETFNGISYPPRCGRKLAISVGIVKMAVLSTSIAGPLAHGKSERCVFIPDSARLSD